MIRIPGYILKREIGSGGMAKVYLAIQTSLERQVALKVMSPALVADESFSKRFLREARTIAELSHPNIVSIYDVGITRDHLHYFSMQHLPGGDFEERLKRGVPERELIRVLMAIASALGYAHELGFIHRDVTPANILFDASDHPVLTDFGIARAVSRSTRITGTGISIGTSHYMSPEQARGKEVDARSDIYALGTIVFEALAGHPPFDGDDGFAVAYSHVFDPVPQLPSRLERWQPFIDTAMAKKAEDRYQSTQELVEVLEQFLQGTTGAGRSAPKPALMSREGISVAVDVASVSPPVRRLRLWGQILRGAPGSWRYLIWGGFALLGLSVAYVWTILCKFVFFFLPERGRPFAGLAVLFGGLAVAGILREQSAVRADQTDIVAELQTPAQQPSPIETPSLPPPRIDGLSPADRETDMARVESSPPDTPALVDTSMLGEDDAISDGGLVEDDDGLNPVVRERVQTLLLAATQDLEENRLTTPVEHNAFERFYAVLSLDPGNQAATQGLEQIVVKYLDLVQASVRRSDYQEAITLLQRGHSVAESITAPRTLLARFDALYELAYARALASAEDAHAARRVEEAVGYYQAALLFRPEDEKSIQAIASLQTDSSVNEPFRDRLNSGGEGPEMVIVEIPEGGQVARLAASIGEITVGEYQRFVEASNHHAERVNQYPCRDLESLWRSSSRRTWDKPGFDQLHNHPVTCVNWHSAVAYANWLSTETGLSYRLPSEAEWALLAEYESTGENPIVCDYGNIADSWFGGQFKRRSVRDCGDGWVFTAPGRTFKQSQFGLFDMVGNVREWTADCWSDSPPEPNESLAAERGDNCQERVVRGVSWLNAAALDEALERKEFDQKRAYNTVGFRLVRTLD